jgi:molybdate transport system permease protein
LSETATHLRIKKMVATDITTCILTLKLASATTGLLLIIGIPVGWWLSVNRSWFCRIVEGLALLPIVLPPTVVGFYLLMFLGPHGFIGKCLAKFHLPTLVFSFEGLLVSSVIVSLPFVIYPIRSGFESIGKRHMDAAYVLRARPLDAFLTVALPMNRSAILTAAVLSFAHTVGEFGVVLMVGGAIPGKTQVLSVAIFNYVEAMEYGRAHFLALLLIIIALVSFVFVNIINVKKGLRVAH